MPAMHRHSESYRGALGFVAKTTAIAAGVLTIAYAAELLPIPVGNAQTADARIDAPLPSATPAAGALIQDPVAYYPAQFPAPRGEPEPHIANH